MKNTFKKTLKTLGILFLVFVFALGVVHFHAGDLSHHQDCLACSFINLLIITAQVSLTLAVFLLIARRVLSEIVFYTSHPFSLERLRAPPQ